MYVRNWFRILVLCQADSQLNFRPSTRRFILCLLIWKISKRYDVIESFPWLFIAYSVYCSCSLKWKIASFWKCWKLIFYCFFVVNAVFLDVVGGIEWKGFWRHFIFILCMFFLRVVTEFVVAMKTLLPFYGFFVYVFMAEAWELLKSLPTWWK